MTVLQQCCIVAVMSAAATYRAFLSLQGRGLLALPPDVRKRLGLDVPGAQVEVVEREDGVVELRPQVPVPASQAWFWTREWQAREREAQEEFDAGRVTTYPDGDAFLDSLGD